MKVHNRRIPTPQRRVLAATAAGLLLGAGSFLQPALAQTDASPIPSGGPVSGTATAAAVAKGDLLTVAKTAGNFQTLLKVLEVAGLTSKLQSAGPYTIFAPTDAAFAKLPAGTLDNLLKPENKAQLVALVSYHVAEGKFTTADLSKVDEVKTLEGTELDIEPSVDGKTIEVDEGKIVSGGSEASNGVLHALDTVLQP